MCGQAEFYGIDTNSKGSAYVVNAMTPLVNNAITISAYNPTHKELSWVENTRIEQIDLLYRNHGSSSWAPALDVNANHAAFYDDVSGVRAFCNLV